MLTTNSMEPNKTAKVLCRELLLIQFGGNSLFVSDRQIRTDIEFQESNFL